MSECRTALAVGSELAWWVGVMVVAVLLLAAVAYFLATRTNPGISTDQSHGVGTEPTRGDASPLEYRPLPHEDFLALHNFFANQFHEDWAWDFADADAAIRDYLGVAFPEQVDTVRTELDEVLALGPSEDDMERVLVWNLGCS